MQLHCDVLVEAAEGDVGAVMEVVEAVQVLPLFGIPQQFIPTNKHPQNLHVSNVQNCSNTSNSAFRSTFTSKKFSSLLPPSKRFWSVRLHDVRENRFVFVRLRANFKNACKHYSPTETVLIQSSQSRAHTLR